MSINDSCQSISKNKELSNSCQNLTTCFCLCFDDLGVIYLNSCAPIKVMFGEISQLLLARNAIGPHQRPNLISFKKRHPFGYEI